MDLDIQIKNVEQQIDDLDHSLSFAPQNATYYAIYEQNRKNLVDKKNSLQIQYDLLFTPEELCIRSEQLKINLQKQQVECEIQFQAHKEILRQKHETEKIRCQEIQWINEQKEMENKQRIMLSIEKEKNLFLDGLKSKMNNKVFLNQELEQLEKWWDELTMYGQPCNAAYLLQLYQSKKEILNNLIKTA
jgi:hypothetical protein